MTKKIFFSLFLLFPLFAHAQMDSSRLIIRFNGGYADTGSSNGVASLSTLTSNTSAWNVGLVVGLPLGKRWEAGIGLEYMKQKTAAESQIHLPEQYLAQQSTDTDMKLIIGKFYMTGRWQLFNRLYFTPILSTGIGKVIVTQEVKTRRILYDSSLFEQGIFLNSALWYSELETSYNYFEIGFAPAFFFYLNHRFALNLETGSFSFATTDWEWDNKQWLANVNPVYWKLGIIVLF